VNGSVGANVVEDPRLSDVALDEAKAFAGLDGAGKFTPVVSKERIGHATTITGKGGRVHARS
jgi:hypothetical protein